LVSVRLICNELSENNRGIASGLTWGSKPQAEQQKGAASALKVVWAGQLLSPE